MWEGHTSLAVHVCWRDRTLAGRCGETVYLAVSESGFSGYLKMARV